MAFCETEKWQLCSLRIKTSAVVRIWGHISDSTMGQKKGSSTKLPCAQVPRMSWFCGHRMTALWSCDRLLISKGFPTACYDLCSSSTRMCCCCQNQCLHIRVAPLCWLFWQDTEQRCLCNINWTLKLLRYLLTAYWWLDYKTEEIKRDLLH